MSKAIIDPALFRKVLGTYPTGVCAITAMDEDGSPIGMVVGTFTSISLDPPLVGFLPDKCSSTWALIEKTGRFCVNVLGSDQQADCRQLAAKGADKFAGLDWALSPRGMPALTQAITRIDCSLHSVVDAGDHWFVMGSVLALESLRSDDPMLFHGGRYGGFSPIS